MHRRRYLRVAASAGLAGLAGCSGLDDEGTTPDDEGHKGDGPASPSPDDKTPTPRSNSKTRSFSGTGETTTGTFSRQRAGPTAFSMLHRGSGDFSVRLLDGDGERGYLLANAVGRYFGVGLYALTDREYSLDVEAAGDWEVEIHSLPVSDTSEDPTGKYGRHHRSFIGPHAFSGGEHVTFSAEDGGTNVVWLKDEYGERSDRLFDEEGRVDQASTQVDASGVGYLDVQSTGAWSLLIE